MKELVFLLEERSAAALLESLLPRILPQGVSHRLITFEGKQDLAKQLEHRLRGYRNQKARFLVMVDQDREPECRRAKAALVRLCQQSGRAEACLVRIACRELETFYLGDLQAVAEAFNIAGLAEKQQRAKYRNPDRLANPASELGQLTAGSYQKVSGSREIGRLLDLRNHRSASFYQLVRGIERLAHELLTS